MKTNIVTELDATKRLSTLRMAQKLWAGGGLQGLYRGLGPTLLRSIPVNACYLPTFVLVNDALLSDGNLFELRMFAAGYSHR